MYSSKSIVNCILTSGWSMLTTWRSETSCDIDGSILLRFSILVWIWGIVFSSFASTCILKDLPSLEAILDGINLIDILPSSSCSTLTFSPVERVPSPIRGLGILPLYPLRPFS